VALRNKINSGLLAVMLGMGLSVPAYADQSGIEMMVIAVWQGKSARPWNEDLLTALRQKYSSDSFAHAVSAAGMTQSAEESAEYRTRIANVLRDGDDVLLHMAPWKSLAEKSAVSVKFAPTIFGPAMNPDDCARDCGLELSVSAYKPSQIGGMTAESVRMLAGAGFGAPQAVYFDQGMVGSAYRHAAMVEGIQEDWSGVDMTQLKSNLGRFPVYKWNQEAITEIAAVDDGAAVRDQAQMDHVRFGIHAEIADVESSLDIVRRAIDLARKSNRVVRVPIVFNVEDLVHTHGFLTEFIGQARQVVADANIPEKKWTPRNTGWSAAKIKVVAPARSIAAAPAEAEFFSHEELAAMKEAASSESQNASGEGAGVTSPLSSDPARTAH
jgi:hypothetical protein